MPVVSPAISGAILTQFSARSITGRDTFKLASAVGSAVSTYLTVPNLVSCTMYGLAGPIGSINSIAVAGIVPATMSSFMLSKASLKTLTGRDISSLFSAISSGVSQVLSTMILTGTAAGIAVGSGVGRFTKVSDAALSKILTAQLQARSILGRDAIALSDCISFGIINQLKTAATFSLLVTGSVVPIPPFGPIPVLGIPSFFTKVS